MKVVWAVASSGFARTAANRRLQVAALGMPVLVMLVVGLLFGTGGRTLPVGVVDNGGPLGRSLVEQLRRDGELQVRVYAHAAAVRADVRRGRLTGGLLIPAGYDAALRDGREGAVEVVEQPGRPEGVAARMAIATDVARQSALVVAARVASAHLGVPVDRALADAEQLVASGHTARVSHQSPFAYTAPSNLVLFVFMTGMLTSAGLVHSRQLGVTRRMLATPARPAAVIGGQALAMFMVVLVQAVVLLAVGGVLFGVHWGDPLGVALLVLAVTAGGTACGVLLGTTARTPEQAISIAVPAGIALGMLGGCMWSLEFVGPTMRAIGHLVPQAWAMDGFVRLVFVHRSAAGIAPQLAVLTGYTAVLGALAARRLRRSVALTG